MKNTPSILWLITGALYGLAVRFLFGHFAKVLGSDVVSVPFVFGTPIAVGAIVVYGLRHTQPSIAKMLWAPWLAMLLALVGSAVSLMEGSVCIILAAPLFLLLSSIGGLIMGLALRLTGKGTVTLNSIIALPLLLVLVEPAMPKEPRMIEERVSVEVAASPHRIWDEIKTARNIRKEELRENFTHWIGVPRPVEGVNVMTPEGEVRHSKWERGVNFSALVTQQKPDRSITWRYNFTPDSFPGGSLDDHVKIGGKYFDVYDTTFNLIPVSPNLTRLEIISHYRVTTDFNFYSVPVARYIANDFMTTIVQFYKTRSERPIG